MPDERRESIDRSIRELVDVANIDAAATLAIKEYGPELLTYLTAIARDAAIAEEAFAEMSERLWRGLAGFRWEAALRTWAYQLARNSLYTIRRSPHASPQRNLPLSLITSMAAVPRTSTAPFLRNEVKEEVRAVIEALDPEDYELMLLRLDRQMSWKEIARAISDDDVVQLDQIAARCRKRFERIKEQLRSHDTVRRLLDRE